MLQFYRVGVGSNRPAICAIAQFGVILQLS